MEAIIRVDLQKGMKILSEKEMKELIRRVLAEDITTLGTIIEITINKKQ